MTRTGVSGEMWPNGPSEHGLAEHGGELVFTFEIPDDVDDAEVARRIGEVLRAADEVHRSVGGSGLCVKDIDARRF